MFSEASSLGGGDFSGPKVSGFGLYFLVGPLRTGSSLLARCLDDHPSLICLCESEINRALFRDYIIAHHCQRMNAHGLSTEEALVYLDRKKQDDLASFEGWYQEIAPRLGALYDKPENALLGDKSPDFYRSPKLVRHLAENYRLIYTVRNPLAICSSILSQEDSTKEEKAERWSSLVDNFQVWKPYLDSPNLLVVRYEDLVRHPLMTMKRVYAHLGVTDSPRFMTPFTRLHPYRFLWSTAIDVETGIRKDFDQTRISTWRVALSKKVVEYIESDQDIVEFMDRFGYERECSSNQIAVRD